MSLSLPFRFVDWYASHLPEREKSPPVFRDFPSVNIVTLPVFSSRQKSWNHSPPPTSLLKTKPSPVCGRKRAPPVRSG